MKKIIAFAGIALSLVACGGNKTNNDAAQDSARIADSIANVQMQDSITLASVVGTYQDTIAGADCSMFVTLKLNEDKTWTMNTKYITSKEVADDNENGMFKVSGDTITLDRPDGMNVFVTATAEGKKKLQALNADKQLPEHPEMYDLTIIEEVPVQNPDSAKKN
ncbi:MAG: copper resistance protein NlpE N-terminal domain-containing protein [Porphyromonadaceae bacterium]|nr:copper resistance protein NlpE N-terminal domain-containing protein [Porphyromonadaceae bacterium]